MRRRVAKLSLCLLLALAPFSQQAEAARSDSRTEARSSTSLTRTGAHRPGRQQAGRQSGGSWGGISCVPYARSITGMEISGNGRDWWENSAGRYARGQRPRVGSILSFPGSGGMRSGHVAVVSRVVQPRMIEIDHANWGGPGIRRGSVMHNVRVIDVSSDNSWTRVRVQVGYDSSTFGREYPTDGFIHNAPASSSFADADDAPRARLVSYSYQSERRTTRTRRPATSQHQPAPASSNRARAASSARQQAATSARTTSRAPIRVASARPTSR
ncbi:CHAP domain-containing protein [Roseococcus sp. YIM B11640]|uniref:CHAP domain-containing protein n=1 Tax=Roseococcus sp. YIM B11640 TaxID=3133973 RepID=UPI003C7E1C9C